MKMLKLSLIIICFVTLGSATATGQSVQTDTAFPSAGIACGPWIQALDEHEFTVVWTTNTDAAVWVEVAPDDGTHFYQTERPKYYHSEFGRRLIGKLHRVRVTGLEKGTTYRYRIFQQAVLLNEGRKRIILGEGVGSDILKAAPFTVTTLDPDKKKIRFEMVNDIHEDDSLFRQFMEGVKIRKTDLVIFNGDMLSQIESEEQIINGFLRSASQLFAAEIPFFAVRGNHEHRGAYSWEYFNYFPNRENKAWYSFRDGPAFFICMDCGEDKPDSDIRNFGLALSDQMREEEAEWLKQVVNSKTFLEAPVKIVILHMPPEKDGWHGSSEINRLFMPILNRAGIDLMLCGHKHAHAFIDKGAGNSFPILVNSNKWRTDVDITTSEIEINMVDSTGKTVKTYHVD